MGDGIIIDKPEAQNRSQRVAQGLLTVGFWCLFLSLLRPLLALVGWLVGIRLFTHEMIEKNGARLLLEALRTYGLVVLLLAIILRCWAWYNHRRFAGRDKRRKTLPPIPLEEIARFHEVDAAALSLWQEDRRLYVRHNEEGAVLEVRSAQSSAWGYGTCRISPGQQMCSDGCGKCEEGANVSPPACP